MPAPTTPCLMGARAVAAIRTFGPSAAASGCVWRPRWRATDACLAAGDHRNDRRDMPIHFTIDHDKRYVEARAEGETGLEDFENFLDAIVLQGALPYRKLIDSRLAVGTLNDHDIMMLGARMSAYASNLGPRGAIAFVVTSPAPASIPTRVVNLAPADRPAKVFRSEDEARKWLA